MTTPEDIVGRPPRTRDEIFTLDRLAGQTNGQVTFHGNPEVIVDDDGIPVGVDAPPPPVAAHLAGKITLALSELVAANVLPRQVPNLRIVDTATGERIQ